MVTKLNSPEAIPMRTAWMGVYCIVLVGVGVASTSMVAPVEANNDEQLPVRQVKFAMIVGTSSFGHVLIILALKLIITIMLIYYS